jgi:tetratricopeptide (TPR) repeat protein
MMSKNQGIKSRPTGLVSSLVICGVLFAAGFSGCGVASTGQNIQGKRMFEQGQYAQAINAFQGAVRNNPRNADGWYNLGATYYYMGRAQNNREWLQTADNYFRQALVIDPGHSDSWRSLAAMMVESNRTQEAFQLIQSWRANSPGSAEPVIELARMSSESGNLAAAKQLLVDALNIDPNNARALTALGVLREQSGETQLALENYIRSYQANNMQPEVARRIAALQGTVQSAQITPFQPGQNRLGSANQHIPR